MEWLIESVAPAIVAVVQLVVVTAALHVAKLAKSRAARLEAELEALQQERSASS